MPRTLSKSDFKLARTCATKLYYKELGYPQADEENPYLAMLAEGGYMVEQLARLLFPEGVTMEYGGGSAQSASATREALAAGDVTLFEATLLSGQKLARVDILRRRGNRFDLYEVKSKSFLNDDLSDSPAGPLRTKVKRQGAYQIKAAWVPYLEDVTFQVHVLRELYPEAEIVPHLILVEKSRTTTVEGLPGMFEIRRDVVIDGKPRDLDVRFIGDATTVDPREVLATLDVSAEVDELLPEVVAAAEAFVATLAGEKPDRVDTAIGWHCRDCEFRVSNGASPNGFRECWRTLADPTPHIFDLYQLGSTRYDGRPLGDVMIENGATSLYEVNPGHLVKKDGEATKYAARQIIQIEHTRSGEPWVGEGLGKALKRLEYPLHFIDFETSLLALPYHAGMHPYEMVGFQWSNHRVDAPDAKPVHSEWLNARDTWPCLEFVQSLRASVGDSGTVLMWAVHERTTLNKVREQMDRYAVGDPELHEWIANMVGADDRPARLVDLNDLCVKHFFHPAMGGRTSIKVVLDALWKADPVMRQRYTEWTGRPADAAVGPYAGLPPVTVNGTELNVVDGTGAMRAYQAMLYGAEKHDEAVVATWRELLRRYCELDTLAMVLIWDHWRRLTP